MYEVFSMGQDPYAGIETGQLLRFLRSGKRMRRPSALQFPNLCLSLQNDHGFIIHTSSVNLFPCMLYYSKTKAAYLFFDTP